MYAFCGPLLATSVHTLQTLWTIHYFHDKSFWLLAIKIELNAHQMYNIWPLVLLPVGLRAVGCRWVFTIKVLTPLPTYNARLVAQDFRMVKIILMHFFQLSGMKALKLFCYLSVWHKDPSNGCFYCIFELYFKHPIN